MRLFMVFVEQIAVVFFVFNRKIGVNGKLLKNDNKQLKNKIFFVDFVLFC